jgi:hypothetical protein
MHGICPREVVVPLKLKSQEKNLKVTPTEFKIEFPDSPAHVLIPLEQKRTAYLVFS